MPRTQRLEKAPRSLVELREDHRALELRLAELESHLSLSPDEQVERANLKKLKLMMKDQMVRLSSTRIVTER